MLKKITALLALIPMIGIGQINITVTSLPDNTPDDTKIYLVGNINNWDPQDSTFELKPNDDGKLAIQIPEGIVDLEFKFTRGNWESTEGTPSGKYLHNRIVGFTGAPQDLDLRIESWEDLAGAMNKTFSKNVSVLRDQFYIPQLNRFRKIWVYLPPGYDASEQRYPVIYMQDGQNLFDNTSSFAGEWGVDETLDELYKKGNPGAIVIAISNGSLHRNNEYSPWKNVTYGGGEGDAYMDFVVETLKPYVDSNYRTINTPESTALIGSSLGALISTYGACRHPEVFGKIGALSPAYWYSFQNLNRYIDAVPSDKLENIKIYVVAGENEYNSMVSDITSVTENLIQNGVKKENTKIKIDSEGTHTEFFWKNEFGNMYQWFFPSVDNKK